MRSPVEELFYRLVISELRLQNTRLNPSGKLVRVKSKLRDVVREMQICRMFVDDPDRAPSHPILAEELKALEASERALCDRLDVPTDLPEQKRWAMIGSTLAAGQEEFNGGRPRRGRPKKEVSPTSGELVAEIIRRLKSGPDNEDMFDDEPISLEIKSRPNVPGVTDIEIITALKKASPDKALFSSDEKSIAKRVSEARKRERTPGGFQNKPPIILELTAAKVCVEKVSPGVAPARQETVPCTLPPAPPSSRTTRALPASSRVNGSAGAPITSS